LTAKTYDSQYRLAFRDTEGKREIYTGEVSRKEVTVANVVTNINKEGTGQRAIAKKLLPFSVRQK